MVELNKEKFQGRDFICLNDFTAAEINEMIGVARTLKAENKAGFPHRVLKGKTLGMIFTKSSTRTRVAFEVGIYQLGGYGLFLSSRDIQIGRGEPVKEHGPRTVKNGGRNYDQDLQPPGSPRFGGILLDPGHQTA
jgi:ornithine carbamoyltransferase